MDDPRTGARACPPSVWYDDIGRGLLASGALRELVRSGGVRGVTSNPAIFERAIAGSGEYDAALAALAREGLADPRALYERLAIEDVRRAADLLRAVHRESGGRDGFVSLEVSPHLAHDADGTVGEALRLHRAIRRANAMIKVPATRAGIAALPRLLAAGVSVNATLIFGPASYRAVAEAHLAGLEARARRGEALESVAGVASLFVTRLDLAVDRELDAALAAGPAPARRDAISRLRGAAAIAHARVATAELVALRRSARWRALEVRGARVQRLLWASLRPKRAGLPETHYVDALRAPDTVSTLPAETWRAVCEAGGPGAAAARDPERELAPAREVLRSLAELGISLDRCADALLEEGLGQFREAFDRMLCTIEARRQRLARVAPLRSARTVAAPPTR